MAFYDGCICRLEKRIAEEIKLKTVEETKNCTAIVLVKNELIKKYEDEKMNITSTKRLSHHIKELSPDYLKGYIAGNKIDLQNRKKLEE